MNVLVISKFSTKNDFYTYFGNNVDEIIEQFLSGADFSEVDQKS